jgi:2-polyprenyl-6-methoxyphenol hydroxylase-like FAD-dependent oxidoreductase
VKWDAKVISITPFPSFPNIYDITFASGSISTGFDLVVGADGAWSKLRGLLTDETSFYSGLSYIETEIKNVREAPK